MYPKRHVKFMIIKLNI